MKFSEIPVGGFFAFGKDYASSVRWANGHMVRRSRDDCNLFIWCKIDEQLSALVSGRPSGVFDFPRTITGESAFQKKYGNTLYTDSLLNEFLNSRVINESKYNADEFGHLGYYAKVDAINCGFMYNFLDEEIAKMEPINFEIGIPSGYKRKFGKVDKINASQKVIIPNEDIINKLRAYNSAPYRAWLYDSDTNSVVYHRYEGRKHMSPNQDSNIVPVIKINQNAEFIRANGFDDNRCHYMFVTPDIMFDGDLTSFLIA